MELMNREVKQIDGHYQLPLPLKNPKLELPNNWMWMLVERRINQLGRRFRRDGFYFQYYRTFMDDMLAKGCAKNQDHLLHWERLHIFLIMVSSI